MQITPAGEQCENLTKANNWQTFNHLVSFSKNKKMVQFVNYVTMFKVVLEESAVFQHELCLRGYCIAFTHFR